MDVTEKGRKDGRWMELATLSSVVSWTLVAVSWQILPPAISIFWPKRQRFRCADHFVRAPRRGMGTLHQFLTVIDL
jgi:hypothetical protein